MRRGLYPAYRDSGVEWMGKVPEYWDITCVAFIFSQSNAGEVIDKSYWGDGDELLFTCSRHPFASDFSGFPEGKRTSVKDLLLTRNGTPYVHKPPDGAIYSNVIQRITLKRDWDRDFCSYVLSTSCLSLKGYGVSIESLNFEMWKSLRLTIPPLPEQRAIAAFLDRKTAHIDALIAKKERQIDLLQEKRAALISHAVTKGLDPTVPMQDSGIAWLGEIPAHWSVAQFKRVAEISYGLTLQLDRTLTEGTPIISMPNVTKEGQLLLDDVPFAPTLTEEEKRKLLLRNGDLLFNWRSGSPDHVGKTAYFDANGEYTHVSFLLRIRCEPEQQESRYFQMYINNLRNMGFFGSSKDQVNKTYNQTELRRLEVIVPPLNEQRTIVTYLDRETVKIDTLIAKVHESIERLQEYRTALISAAVTGKIDVRDEQMQHI